MQKLCFSTKFSHQEIRWDYGILCSEGHPLKKIAFSKTIGFLWFSLHRFLVLSLNWLADCSFLAMWESLLKTKWYFFLGRFIYFDVQNFLSIFSVWQKQLLNRCDKCCSELLLILPIKGTITKYANLLSVIPCIFSY